MASISGNIVTENFTDSNKLLFPITPWQIITDGGIQKLISNTTSNSGNTSVSFTIKCSHIEIDYRPSSESNYDCLYIYVDGTQQVKASGTPTSSTTFKMDLAYGTHTIQFKYAKDSSGTAGSDRAEIWAIRYTINQPENKFLIADGSNVLTIPTGTTDLTTLTSLTNLGTYPMTDAAYFTNGMNLSNLNYIIQNKRNLIISTSPKILVMYSDLPSVLATSLGTLKVKETPTPLTQIIEMKDSVTFNNADITHISKCTIVANVDTNAILKFVFSKDNGTTWLAFDGTNWITVDKTVDSINTSGMTLDVCNNLTEADLTLISDTKQIKVAWIMKKVGSDNVTIKQIKFDYA
jgi:hypothetical protein